MNTVEKIQKLIDNTGKSVSSIFKELTIPHNALAEWKKGKAKPSAEALDKIAAYFNVSVDYLLGRPIPEYQQVYESLSSDGKKTVFSFMESVYDSELKAQQVISSQKIDKT